MMLDVFNGYVSAQQGPFLATAKRSSGADGDGWAVHAYIGDRQMVSAWCDLARFEAERACKLLIRWLANRPKFRGDLCKAD